MTNRGEPQQSSDERLLKSKRLSVIRGLNNQQETPTVQSLTNDSSRFCHYCGFENPNQYIHCGNCRRENPEAPSAAPSYPAYPAISLVVEIPKSRGTYIILGLLFGWLGVHNIYAKRNNVGAVQLIFFLMFFWTLVVPPILAVWSIVEIFTVKNDGNGIPMR